MDTDVLKGIEALYKLATAPPGPPIPTTPPPTEPPPESSLTSLGNTAAIGGAGVAGAGAGAQRLLQNLATRQIGQSGLPASLASRGFAGLTKLPSSMARALPEGLRAGVDLHRTAGLWRKGGLGALAAGIPLWLMGMNRDTGNLREALRARMSQSAGAAGSASPVSPQLKAAGEIIKAAGLGNFAGWLAGIRRAAPAIGGAARPRMSWSPRVPAAIGGTAAAGAIGAGHLANAGRGPMSMFGQPDRQAAFDRAMAGHNQLTSGVNSDIDRAYTENRFDDAAGLEQRLSSGNVGGNWSMWGLNPWSNSASGYAQLARDIQGGDRGRLDAIQRRMESRGNQMPPEARTGMETQMAELRRRLETNIPAYNGQPATGGVARPRHWTESINPTINPADYNQYYNRYDARRRSDALEAILGHQPDPALAPVYPR